MKAFFEQCLRDLHRLTGLKQYLEICNKPTEAEAKEEMNIIVAGMVRVSEKFNYIPQEAQKRIVAHQIVSDPEMYALNAKIVYKWFNAVSDKYWHESGHIETNAQLKQELNAEPISEETQVMIDKFMSKLAGGTIREVPKVSALDMNKIQVEDKVIQEGRKSTPHNRVNFDVTIEATGKKVIIENVLAEDQEGANKIVKRLIDSGQIKI